MVKRRFRESVGPHVQRSSSTCRTVLERIPIRRIGMRSRLFAFAPCPCQKTGSHFSGTCAIGTPTKEISARPDRCRTSAGRHAAQGRQRLHIDRRPRKRPHGPTPGSGCVHRSGRHPLELHRPRSIPPRTAKGPTQRERACVSSFFSGHFQSAHVRFTPESSQATTARLRFHIDVKVSGRRLRRSRRREWP
jgi:hypothetical protein